jgi:peptide-methionine (S)-S-oxide reductase
MPSEIATFAGGCFWCLDAAYRRLRGVTRVTSGYAGGHVANPTYEQVCSTDTGHAEVVEVEYDPEQVSYRELLEVFFGIHDPTTPDRQGHDVGPQYRSVIFTHSDEQRREAESMIAELERDQTFDAPIVTQLEPLDRFWPAESYHQDYYARHGAQPYCVAVISPKLAKLRKRFAEKLTT